MTVKIEVEHKYIIAVPISWSSIAGLIDCAIEIKRINQTYCSPKKGEQAARVRETKSGFSGDLETYYHYNKKKPTGDTGAHKETEYEISKKEYEEYLKDADPNKCAVEKLRFVFKWHDQIFELDLFRGHLKGLAILEIELADADDTIELPPFLKVIKDITKLKEFNNYSLANKKHKSNESSSKN